MSRQPCSVEGCEELPHGNGLCGTHYAQNRKTKGAPCWEPDCERKIFARCVCQMHYKRLVDAGLIRKDSCVAYKCYEPAVASRKCATHAKPRTCRVPGCEVPPNDATRCPSHYNRRLKYGLTDEQMAALDRGVQCKLCPELATVVDHCHETGAVRGFLCKPCNTGLGHFRDNPDVLANAIQYLQRGDTTRVRDIHSQLGLAA